MIEGFPLRKNFDCDNVVKGLCDALTQAEIILDDRQLCTMHIEKCYTTNANGRIEFDLFYHEKLLKTEL
jgi:Holliday junction resolvase RusA-like endonuclease